MSGLILVVVWEGSLLGCKSWDYLFIVHVTEDILSSQEMLGCYCYP